MARWLIPLLVFAAALSADPRRPPPAEPIPDVPRGLVALAADFHVHGFPGDGALPPWAMSQEAARRGLDAIALTNHNAVWPWRLMSALGLAGDGALLIPGEEVTAPRFHAAAIGVVRRVDWRGSLVDVAARVHAQGGVVIVAHPDGAFQSAITPAGLQAIDGIEAAHPEMAWPALHDEIVATYMRAVAEHPGVAAIGSSDTHFFAPVGVCRTFVFAAARSSAAILEAIRAGRTVSCDVAGVVRGPAALTPLVAGACRRAAAASGRPQGTPRAWIAWMALLALLLADLRRGASVAA